MSAPVLNFPTATTKRMAATAAAKTCGTIKQPSSTVQQPSNPRKRATKPKAHLTPATSRPDVVHVMNGDGSLLELSRDDRRSLLAGDKVKVFVNDDLVGEVPYFLISTATAMAYPLAGSAGEIRLEMHGDINEAFSYLLGWLEDTCTKMRAYRLPKQDDMGRNHTLVRVAEKLGMAQYVKHISATIWAIIKGTIPTLAQIEGIEWSAISYDDAFFKCLADRLALLEFTDAILNRDEYNRFMVARCPHLASAIVYIHRKSKAAKAKRDAQTKAQKAKIAAQNDQKKQSRGKGKQRNGGRRQNQEAQLVKESATRKMAAGGVHMITPEELRYLYPERGWSLVAALD